MLNIIFKGKYKNEEQIKRGYLHSNATIFKEPNSISVLFIIGAIFSSPILIATFIGLLHMIDINTININTYIFIFAINIILTYIHEIIHALGYPKSAVKEIWNGGVGSMFVYCNAPISKKGFYGFVLHQI